MTVPVVVDIDLRYRPVHFRNMVAMIVVDIAVERILNELVSLVERATNWTYFEL